MTFEFGTKAETLERLQPLVTGVTIPELFYFSVGAWRASRDQILDTIGQRFRGRRLALRSSALIEDGEDHSMAGAFLSMLGVDGGNRSELIAAIESIRESMTGDHRDQVLVQLMADKVSLSGVVMTFDMVHGAPYYCIEYDDETGRTDSVTAGTGIKKGLFVYRHVDGSMLRSPRMAKVIALARQLEDACGCAALDIEFGMTEDEHPILFQVRRIAQSRNWHPVTERRVRRELSHVDSFIRRCSAPRDGILGDRTILAIMPDWNPAEIIGTTPRQLSASLYRELITREVWHAARAAMGYRPLDDAELMVVINHHPYIDVRNSFNSFLPAGLGEAIGAKLVNGWLDRLEAHPEFHDKVEFEIVATCMDFCFEENFRTRYPGLLGDDEFHEFRGALVSLTRGCLSPGPGNTLDAALADAAALADIRPRPIADGDAAAHLVRASYLLNQTKKLGTRAFAIVARHAFIAEALLRTAVRRGALTQARLDEFRRSVRTITGDMVAEYAQVCRGQMDRHAFLDKYGHLRPGTYEITSLRYDERSDLFLDEIDAPAKAHAATFALSSQERRAIEDLLAEAGLDVLDAEQLLAYARKATAAREHVKFIFTRNLSDALSAVLRWGHGQGLSRDDLSYLDWPTIAASLTQPVMDEIDRHYLDLADAGRRSVASAHAFRMSHIIFSERDIYVATINRSVPNFIGTGSVSGKVVQLTADSAATIDIKGKIVCIQNADPGFDWIFTKGLSALVTQYGGANSHMAIRCAELGLPAAIGCGDQIYLRIASAGSVELNCMEKVLRPLHGK